MPNNIKLYSINYYINIMTYKFNDTDLTDIIDTDAVNGTDLDTSFNNFPIFITTTAAFKVSTVLGYQINGNDITTLYNIHPKSARRSLGPLGTTASIPVPTWAKSAHYFVKVAGGNGLDSQTYPAVSDVSANKNPFLDSYQGSNYIIELQSFYGFRIVNDDYVKNTSNRTIIANGYAAGTHPAIDDGIAKLFTSNKKEDVSSVENITVTKDTSNNIYLKFDTTDKLTITPGSDASRTIAAGTTGTANFTTRQQICGPDTYDYPNQQYTTEYLGLAGSKLTTFYPVYNVKFTNYTGASSGDFDYTPPLFLTVDDFDVTDAVPPTITSTSPAGSPSTTSSDVTVSDTTIANRIAVNVTVFFYP